MKFLIAIATAVAVSVPALAAAGETLVETEPFSLRLNGFLSEYAAVTHLPYETFGLVEPTTGLNAGVLRFEWEGEAGDHVSFQLHNRFFHRISSASGSAGSAFGVGSSVAPNRTLDTRSELVAEAGLLVEHDLDRAVVNVFTPLGDVYVGRQAITWGNSTVFTVSDLWTRFSPFELDTSQKRGVDAVRFLGYPGGIELDVVLDVTDFDAPGGGVRAGWTLDRADSYGALAWRNDRLHALMGLGLDLDVVRAHGELNLPWNPDDGQLDLPRATIGVDYLAEKFSVVGEYHYNGPGASEDEEYLAQYQSTEVQNGDRYLVGKHYAGAAIAWIPNEVYSVTMAGLVNLLDPSAVLTPTASLTVSQNVTVAGGAYVGIGEEPQLAPTPALGSEFGPSGTTYFLQMTAFY